MMRREGQQDDGEHGSDLQRDDAGYPQSGAQNEDADGALARDGEPVRARSERDDTPASANNNTIG
ncbi:MAG: hypothetical protein M5R36_27935 [Deltaproteobacteria bacterium]|nr:hypothetical protein [Deltaproteobacteria bacterium]